MNPSVAILAQTHRNILLKTKPLPLIYVKSRPITHIKLLRQNVCGRAAVSAGADLAAVHMDELQLLLWAEWWVATLGRGRWWVALAAGMRKLFWRGALEFYCCDRATGPGKLLAKLYRLAIHGWSENRIGKKVIGRGSAICNLFSCGERGFARSRRVFALVNQPTGHGRGRIFFEPLVHQRADLFAKVGGMAEAREFITLQAVTRSGQQELPGGLGAVAGHEGLLWGQGGQCGDSITVVYRVKNYWRVLSCGKLWKTRGASRDAELTEIDEKTQRSSTAKTGRGGVDVHTNQLGELTLHAACSACTGDYENPERSAPPSEFSDEEYEGEHEAATTANEKTVAQ